MSRAADPLSKLTAEERAVITKALTDSREQYVKATEYAKASSSPKEESYASHLRTMDDLLARLSACEELPLTGGG